MTQRYARAAMVLAAAIAGVGATASASRAQYAVGADGRLGDASTRIGSGGYNYGGNLGTRSLYSNLQNLNSNIATGNVTGLSYFHNGTGTFDPNVLQSTTATGPSDRLNQIAGPVNYAQPSNGRPNYTTFYTTSGYAGSRPDNYAPILGGAALTPTGTRNPLTPTTDNRLGVLTTGSDQEGVYPPSLTGQQPTPGATGPLNPAANTSVYYTASPLYGVRQGTGSADADDYFIATSGGRGPAETGAAGGPGGTYAANAYGTNAASLRRMREDLSRNALPNDTVPPAGGFENGANPYAPAPNGTNANPANPANRTGGVGGTATPGNGNLDTGPLSNAIGSAPLGSNGGTASPPAAAGAGPLTGSVAPAAIDPSAAGVEGTRMSLVIPAARQSKQLADLIKRYQQNGTANAQLTPEQSIERYNAEVRAQRMGGLKAAAGVTPARPNAGTAGGTFAPSAVSPGLQGGGSSTRPAGAGPADRTAAEPQAFVITSLADGIKADGLAGLFRTAEQQMKAGKYVEAAGTYNDAAQVAPNNPFVPLGKAFAELGASYYGRADADLTRAITAEPAVLIARYDLTGFLGQTRLGFLKQDLTDIAASDTGARPLVLLAYINHNLGDDKTAAQQLDAASARGGGYEAVIKLMRQVWQLR